MDFLVYIRHNLTLSETQEYVRSGRVQAQEGWLQRVPGWPFHFVRLDCNGLSGPVQTNRNPLK